MLILSHPDCFWVNFNKLCQRVLQSACNRYGTAQCNVKIRELFRCQFRSRIYGRSCFTYYHILNRRTLHFRNHFCGKQLCFLRGSTIANGYHRNTMFGNHIFYHSFAFLRLCLGMSWINHTCIQYPSGCVHDRHFTACTIPRVKSHCHISFYRRLH